MPHSDRPDPAVDVAGLVDAARRGDAEAWRRLVELYGRRVFALVKSRCHRDDLAEEVTQSVFVTVAEQLGSNGYTERGRFESWLFLIAMNRLRDEVRRSGRRPAALGDALPDSPGAAPEPSADPEDFDRLRAAIASLTDADRSIIELRHHAGLGFRQIAEVLHEPIGTLLARHHRALAKLRDMLSTSKSPSAPRQRTP